MEVAGYVLKNGKRYYEDENGNLSLDNVSQAEADRRERLSSSHISIHSSAYNRTSHNTIWGTGTKIGFGRVPWRVVILIGIILMFVAAFFYNQNHVSPAEKAISDYMDNVTKSD